MTATHESFNEPLSGTHADNNSADATPDAESELHEQLLLALQEARAQADEHRNQLLRTRAEMENMRRRAERDLENAHKYSLERFINEVLPVKDSLEMGLTAVNDEATDIIKIREGMELTLKIMHGLLQKMAVREINPLGEKFNPDMHQAMSVQATADTEPNTVVAVYQKGYSLNERVVRPAMVVVSKAP